MAISSSFSTISKSLKSKTQSKIPIFNQLKYPHSSPSQIQISYSEENSSISSSNPHHAGSSLLPADADVDVAVSMVGPRRSHLSHLNDRCCGSVGWRAAAAVELSDFEEERDQIWRCSTGGRVDGDVEWVSQELEMEDQREKSGWWFADLEGWRRKIGRR